MSMSSIICVVLRICLSVLRSETSGYMESRITDFVVRGKVVFLIFRTVFLSFLFYTFDFFRSLSMSLYCTYNLKNLDFKFY